MALRKGHCYSKMEKPYTRKSKVKSKSYIKAIPQSKISKFVMGNVQAYFQNKYPARILLIVTEPVQIRDNALEASRQFVHRHLEETLKGDYYFTVSAYPHHVLRENKMLTGAGADRMQTGMQLSFGNPVGIAARLNKGNKIFAIACKKEAVPFIRGMLEKVKAKMPGKKAIVVE